MNTDLLLTHFERLCEAPGAVPRLRGFILDLAVRGKLVEQDPADEPANELLRRIRTLKQEAAAELHIRGEQDVEVSKAGVLPEIPASWAWVLIDDFALVQGGKRLPTGATFSKNPTAHMYIRVTDMKHGTVLSDDLRYITADVQRPISKYTISQDDLYITIAGTIGQVGRVPNLVDGHNLTENAAKIVFRGTNADYLCKALSSDFVQEQFREKTKQMAQPKLALKRILGARLALPPLAEQHRIVAKLDELMALCDRLETAQVERERRRDRLTTAAAQQLSETEDGETFRRHTQFYVANLAQMTVRPEQMEQLRATVLNLAVRGKLVEQDPADEPAAQLLKRIVEEKARLVKSGTFGKPKSLLAFDDDALPFTIPPNWSWTQLAAIGFISPRNSASDGTAAAFVPMAMISVKYSEMHSHEVRPWSQIKSGFTHFAEGDVGLAKITPCFENGKSTVFRGLTGGLGAGTTELHIVRPVLVDADYILLFLKSSHFIQSGIPRMTGTAGQKRVSTEYFAHSPFPLPPLAEQYRIVAKVDKLMALCDRLETQLHDTRIKRGRLLDAAIHRALE